MAKAHYASTGNSDMFYAVGARIADPFFLIEKDGERTIFLNALEIGAFKEKNRGGLEVKPLEPLQNKARAIPGDGNGLQKLAYAIFEECGLLKTPIEVSRRFPLDVADYLRSRGVGLNVAAPFMPERAKKSSQEIAHIRTALGVTCDAFKLIEKILSDSKIAGDSLLYNGEVLTSEFLKREVDAFFYENQMEDTEGMIISSGKQASMPHHKGSGPIFPHQTIVCDLFPRHRESGYFADMTRTYAKGSPSPQVSEMYDAVKKAQDKAFELIRPGAKAKDIHNAAAQVIKDAGFDVGEKGFIHSLGHGLGLDLHERPNIGANSDDTLEAGNVITIEPGLYYAELGGVRLEDVVAVTGGGFENLMNYPRDFVIP